MTARLEAAARELVEALLEELRDGVESSNGQPERLLSVAEATERLSIGRTALYELLSGGRIRSVSIGRRRLVPESAIAEYIAAHEKARPNQHNGARSMPASVGTATLRERQPVGNPNDAA